MLRASTGELVALPLVGDLWEAGGRWFAQLDVPARR